MLYPLSYEGNLFILPAHSALRYFQYRSFNFIMRRLWVGRADRIHSLAYFYNMTIDTRFCLVSISPSETARDAFAANTGRLATKT